MTASAMFSKVVVRRLALLLLTFLCISEARALTCTPPPEGVIHWWPGDGNAQDIVGGSHGVPQNGTTFASGHVGQAFSFDGENDFVTIDTFTALDGLSSATFEFWVNMDAFPSDPQCNSGSCGIVFFSKNDFGLAVAVHSSLAIEVSRGNGSSWGGTSHTLSSGTLTGLNQWNHVAVVVNGTTDSIYINGVLDTSNIQDEAAFANFGGLVFGAGFSGDYIFLEGQLDEITVYDRALADEEIESIYNAGNAGKCKVISVAIDIKPGSVPNSINPNNNGVIPVAVLTTSDFDATSVDPMSVAFGPAEAREAHGRGHMEDIDSDGDTDLVLHFWTQDTGITCGEISAPLTGTTIDGHVIQGLDSTVTVGCG
jgi:hypothetical protein